MKLLITFVTWVLLIIALPVSAAPQLQAAVERTQIAVGETLIFTLTLSDVSDVQTPNDPDLTPLRTFFNVAGQEKFASSTITNGQAKHQIVWRYLLEPEKSGTLLIPALSLKTPTGNLLSQAITITVADSSSQTNDNIRLEATVSDANPYLHQPILYTLRLYHRGDVRNMQFIPPNQEVIVEQLGQITERNQTVNGQAMVVAEVSYLLTPLRSGKLELGDAKAKGAKPDTTGNHGGFFNFNITSYRPLSVRSNPLILEVKSPESQPWLPLNAFKLEQKWDSDLSKIVSVGTPLVRTLTLTAEGMGGQAAPTLDNFMLETNELRIRSPKPTTERKLLPDGKTPVSTISQTFSIIPLKVGMLQLPAVKIPWWNVQKQTMMWAELPAQTLQVVDNPRYASDNPAAVVVAVPQQATVGLNQAQYAFLMLSLTTLVIALGYSWRSRYLAWLSLATAKIALVNEKLFKQRLESLDQPTAIKQWLQEYACQRWLLPPNTPLMVIAQYVNEHYTEGEQFTILIKELEANLYGQHPLDISRWKATCQQLLNINKKVKPMIQTDNIRLQPLNPG